MECAVALSSEGIPLSPSSLVDLASTSRLPSLTFHLNTAQFTVDYEPSTSLLSHGERLKTARSGLCHFEGVDQSGRESWLSACSKDNLSLILRTSSNVFHLRVNDDGSFVLIPQTQPSCDFSTSHRYRRQARVAKANPAYYSEFAEVLQRRRFVEFAFVADHSIYEKYDKDVEKVTERLQTIANMMNSFYKPINIEIRLVYTEVWSNVDPIEVQADSDKTLDAFLQYRKTIAHPNDNAHMLTDVRFANGVVGKAFKGTMCSFDYSGGVNVDHQKDAALVASTIAHEMGHNFGMDHDVDYESTCKCPAINGRTHCIMAPSAGWEAPSHWSDCSLSYLSTSLGRGVDLCLLNEPDSTGKAVCGNGIVEDGEDCDCGQAGCNHDCCDPSTCKLKLTTKAECAAGQCCDLLTCKPKERATLCRAATNECDLPEFCDGRDQECPADFFVQDGLKCPKDDEAFCFNGECGSRAGQCRKLWGPTGRAAADACYMTNTKGTVHGNCGYDAHYDNYTACPEKDKMCGRLHCDKDSEAPVFGNPSSVTVANSHFFNRDKNAYDSCFVIKTAYETNNKRKHTPGMTLDGTKCGNNRVCLQTRCVPLNDITKTASKCDDDCNGHGTCNNVGNCHCENGYGGVSCNIPGLGGSVNSNPANMSRGTDVLIITLVLLLLCIAGFIIATIHWKRKGKGFLPKIIWKAMKEHLNLRGILVPTRKAPPPPSRPGHSRMQKDSLNGAWGDTGVTYSARGPPMVVGPNAFNSFSSPSSSPDPLLPPAPVVELNYHKPTLVLAPSVSPRPADPPPSLPAVPARPRNSIVTTLYKEHGEELGIRSKAPPPPKKDPAKAVARTDSISRPGMKPPPPPHKPQSISQPSTVPPPPPPPPKHKSPSPASSSSTSEDVSRLDVRSKAALFERK